MVLSWIVGATGSTDNVSSPFTASLTTSAEAILGDAG